MRNVTRWIGLLLLVCVLTASAQAAPITLNNPSFETPVLENTADGYYTATVEGWLKLSSGTGSGAIGLIGDIMAPYVPQGAQDGVNVLMVQADTEAFTTVYQSMGIAEAGKVYTVSAYVAKFAEAEAVFPYPGYGMYLYDEVGMMGGVSDVADWQAVGMDVGASPLSDAWTQVSFTVTASAEQDGQEMTLYISSYTSAETTPYVIFDSVSADVVPEPTTLGLLAVGSLLAVSRKRRR